MLRIRSSSNRPYYKRYLCYSRQTKREDGGLASIRDTVVHSRKMDTGDTTDCRNAEILPKVTPVVPWRSPR